MHCATAKLHVNLGNKEADASAIYEAPFNYHLIIQISQNVLTIEQAIILCNVTFKGFLNNVNKNMPFSLTCALQELVRGLPLPFPVAVELLGGDVLGVVQEFPIK